MPGCSCMGFVLPPPLTVIDGMSVSSPLLARAVGIEVSTSSLNVCCRFALWTSMTGVSPVTVMVSATAPTFMSAFTIVTMPTLTSRPSRLTVLKPVSVKVTEYGPGRRLMMRYWPVPSVTTVRTFSISSGLAASTVTPGSTAPEASLTTPPIVAVDSCARAADDRRSTTASAAVALRHLHIRHLHTKQRRADFKNESEVDESSTRARKLSTTRTLDSVERYAGSKPPYNLAALSRSCMQPDHQDIPMKRPTIAAFVTSVVASMALIVAVPLAQQKGKPKFNTWRQYLGSSDSSQYSSLDQINRKNVAQLQVAWTYASGDTRTYRFNPIVVDGVMYTLAKNMALVALDAATGQEIWTHPNQGAIGERGMNYWESADRKDRRLLYINGGFLTTVDATTGKTIETFGE